ncbi:MAG TPA: tRNA guanosine(34) transglycosylase Tgt [Phycisphaerae bacterium]|nr:tRNA guanosine(34) transglycosylase Tgt [Phycisphaerae bacterium]
MKSKTGVTALQFSIQKEAAGSRARLGILTTPHGLVHTPVFMPVGTRASVKGLMPEQLRAAGTTILLANTYHLAIRPGAEVVAQLGGLHHFMGWSGPLLTDSGGFQVFSLATLNRVDDDGVTFKSHVDGAVMRLDPVRAIRIQELLGADIIMAFDQCPALPAERAVLEDAVDRTIQWAARCKEAHTRDDQALFGIVQGGLDLDLRCRCLDELVAIDFPGYAVGGLSVGEKPEQTVQLLQQFAWKLPRERPRYLMGVGRPIDIIEAVAAGMDMFDCVMPTRNGRNSFAFTDAGFLRLRNTCFKTDDRPLEEGCDCHTCAHFSRAYLRHLFLADEMLGPILVSLHNIAYYHRWMKRIRDAIAADTFERLLAETRSAAQSPDDEESPCQNC